jgi:sugar-phosphatase
MNIALERATHFECEALLFDLDGVLVDSSAVVERCWKQWAEEQGLSTDVVLSQASGRRIVETVRELAPHLDAEAEAQKLAAREAQDTEGLQVIPGAAELIQELSGSRCWAVVTSGQRQVALSRLRFTGLQIPPVLVSADDVSIGKPHPQPYLSAVWELNCSPRPASSLVIEDSLAGLVAAQSAGMRAVGVKGTHSPSVLASHADAVVENLRALDVCLHEKIHVTVCAVQ